MKKERIIGIVILLVIVITIILLKGKKKMIDDIELEGESTTNYLKGYSEKIKSKEITYFSYEGGDFFLEAKKEEGKTQIFSSGGNIYQRDGSRFKVKYETKNLEFLLQLSTIVFENKLSKNNGYTHHVNGLPEGLGGVLDIRFASDERIYKSDNQNPIMPKEVETIIYDLFHEEAKKNNLDFTTEGSNHVIYDDADIAYLQGTWQGKHFGDHIKVIIQNKNIKIYVNDKLTDDTEYSIFEGSVRTNKLVSEVTEPKDYHDYEEFEGLSALAKKNDFTLTAYFMKDSYSTCDLLKVTK